MLLAFPVEVITTLAWITDCYIVGALQRTCTAIQASAEIVFLKYQLLYLLAKRRGENLLRRELGHVGHIYKGNYFQWKKAALVNNSLRRLFIPIGYRLLQYGRNREDHLWNLLHQDDAFLEDWDNRFLH